jgi:hypothetical protein
MIRKAIKALMKSPYRNRLPLTVKNRPAKSGLPPMAAISGVIRSFTSAVTTAPNAAPMTTAMARSMRLPFSRNFWKPVMIGPSLV